ncbi:MAG: carboxylesterase/lipase family protein, partial [Bacteroidales bacterium]|nr:carboxylesterase/lipase family protein [Bacteroidales bacterium]
MRRYIHLLAAALSAATLLISCASNNGGSIADSDGQILFYGDDIAVAQTTYGKVRGYILRDIYT